MALQDPQELGELKGKYEVLAELGQGGMGKVYKVKHRSLDVVRVIKVMRAGLANDEKQRIRFTQEARKLCRLDHPNIARLWDFEVNEAGTMFMVIEYIDGQDLANYLREQGPPELGLALDIACQSLEALDCLHKEGWIHRDISPDNIMLAAEEDGSCRVKLIDLGIAKDIKDAGGLTQRGHFIGKIRYASPEQLGVQLLTTRSDVYSFGVVLYELLTGRHPVRGSDVAAIVAAHTTGTLVPFETADPEGRIPDELRAAVMKSLRRDPTERYATAKEFVRALDKLRQGLDLGRTALEISRPGTTFAGGGGSAQRALEGVFPADETTRARRLDGHLTRIDELLEARNLFEAEREIGRGQREHGDLRAFEDRTRTLERMKERRRAEEVAELMRSARSLRDGGDCLAALRLLERVRDLDAEAEGLAELAAELEARERDRQRRQAIAEAVQSLEQALDEGELERATRMLASARGRLGEEPFRELERRIDEERGRRRRELLATATRRIEALLGEARFDEAAVRLEEAEAELGGESALGALRARLARTRRAAGEAHRQREELLAEAESLLASGRAELALPLLEQARGLGAERAAELEQRARQAVATREAQRAWESQVRQRLRAGRLDEVRAMLAEGGLRWPDSVGPSALAQELEAAEALRQQEAESAAERERADRLVEQAQGLFEAGELAASRERLVEALALLPDHILGTYLLERVDAERKAVDAASAAARQIRALLGRGEAEAARSALDEARRRHGDRGGLAELGVEIESRAAQERQRRAQALLGQAVEQQRRGDLAGALERVERVLALVPEDERARACRDSWKAELDRRETALREAAEREERARQVALECAAVFERVARAEALQPVELRGLDRDLAEIGERLAALEAGDEKLLERVEAARADVERLLLLKLRRRAEGTLAQARALQERGQHRPALELLRGLDGEVRASEALGILRPEVDRGIARSREAVARRTRVVALRAAGVAVLAAVVLAAWYAGSALLEPGAASASPERQEIQRVLALPQGDIEAMSARITELIALDDRFAAEQQAPGVSPARVEQLGRLREELQEAREAAGNLREAQRRLNALGSHVDDVLAGRVAVPGPDVIRSQAEVLVDDLNRNLDAIRGDSPGDAEAAERMREERNRAMERLDAFLIAGS